MSAQEESRLWAPGTETMHPPPVGSEADRLAALNFEPVVIETQGDVSAAVVTHSVYARVAYDEEWASFYGSAASSEATARMETADNAMYAQFGIDFRLSFNVQYFSSPNTGRSICTLLSELQSKVGRGVDDVVVGYVNNPMTGSSYGCATTNYTIVHLHGSTTSQRQYNVWTTSQHEFSHLFNAPDRYPDPNNLHTNDVMEDHYNFPNLWCKQTGYNDWGRVNGAAGTYD